MFYSSGRNNISDSVLPDFQFFTKIFPKIRQSRCRFLNLGAFPAFKNSHFALQGFRICRCYFADYFIVDENIVFKDPTTGQYMIMYKSMSYPIDSDLGKEAISFYQSQGTNALVLLHRLQEKEQAQGQIQNGEQTAVAQSETKIKNEQLKAENDDLKNLVELQEQAIKELKTSLIKIAKDQTKQKALSTSGSKTLSIPKGAKRLDAFAVVGDRAWMTDSQNHTYTVYVGQKMPDNRTVYAADENEQAIWVK